VSQRIRVVQIGCGPIGSSVVRYALQRSQFEFVGAVDKDEDLVGKDLGHVAGVGRELDVRISSDLNGLLESTKPELAFHTTVSSIEAAFPQIEQCISHGVNVVSTCEELSYPYESAPHTSEMIDRTAKENNVTVLGTGVNPGFLMDAWPLFMSAVSQEVAKIKVARIQNASTRRSSFQRKIGAGRTLEEFQSLAETGALRHVGLSQSIAMIAAGLGWRLDEIAEEIEPIIAKERVDTEYVTVQAGEVSGVRQVGSGMKGDEELIRLEFEASVDAPDSYDAVFISGVPELKVAIEGGVHGDLATAAVVVNAAHRLVAAESGLATMKDMPVICGHGRVVDPE
jgi:hypothetical protein